MKIDGNEIWEFLFGYMKGDVPKRLDEATLAALADHINTLVVSPSQPTAKDAEIERATHRHKKRGSEYVLLGIGKMQSTEWKDMTHGLGHSIDMAEVAIYRSATDPAEIWVRPREEFEDGRFEALSSMRVEGQPKWQAIQISDDPIERLAYDLAVELEQADLDRNDFVTVNRTKLSAIARRCLERLSPAQPGSETQAGVVEADNLISRIEARFPNWQAYRDLEDCIDATLATAKADAPWFPPPMDERPDGFECFIWHRGRWRHVRWVSSFQGWMLGYASAYAPGDLGRMFAPLPTLTPPHNFWEGEES